MKIAVTYDNGQIFQHFGHTELFKFYNVEDGKIISTAVMPTLGSGHGALAGFLSSMDVDTLICGGIGDGARAALTQVGITLYGGTTGSADEAVQALLDGKLAYDPDAKCGNHGEGHSHGEDHTCSGHDCTLHSCGEG